MTSPLISKVEEVIWSEEKDVHSAVKAIVKYQIFPGVIWDLRAWARCKAKEHGVLQSNIERILAANGPHSAVEYLRIHHGKISIRYGLAAQACDDYG